MYTVEFTDKVLKWLRRADSHYRSRALDRMRQLSSGRRSYCLSKRLKTSFDMPLYETKLDKGMRILWMERDRVRADESTDGAEKNIFLWYIAKHDEVQTCVHQIANSLKRMADHVNAERERCSQLQEQADATKGKGKGSSMCTKHVCAFDSDTVAEDDYYLNPDGNSPVRVYTLPTSSFTPALSGSFERDAFRHMWWQPPLRLARDENDVIA